MLNPEWILIPFKNILMYNLSILVFCSICFYACGHERGRVNQISVDSVFVSWNKATIRSIDSQERSSTNSKEKELLANRLLAFKAYVDIREADALNKASIRYKFLEMLVGLKLSSTFYVVEANSSGEMVKIGTLVYDDRDKKVYSFEWKDSAWRATGAESASLQFKYLENYHTRFGEGGNQDDITITLFENYSVKQSFFYLFATLSDNPWSNFLKKM